MTNRDSGWRTDAALDRVRAKTRLVLFWVVVSAAVAISLAHAESKALRSIESAFAVIPHG